MLEAGVLVGRGVLVGETGTDVYVGTLPGVLVNVFAGAGVLVNVLTGVGVDVKVLADTGVLVNVLVGLTSVVRDAYIE